MPWGTVQKPANTLGGEAGIKPLALDELRAAWAIDREWRHRPLEVTAAMHGCWSPHLLAAV